MQSNLRGGGSVRFILGVRRLVAYCLNSSCQHEASSAFPNLRRYRSAELCQQDRVRQVRSAWPPHRRAAELERAAVQIEFVERPNKSERPVVCAARPR
jgi:hypothetical protein